MNLINNFPDLAFFLLLLLISCVAEIESKTRFSRRNEDSEFVDTVYNSPNYKFQYGVYESTHGNDFGHEEERNGEVTRGQYRVKMPDGRVQVVTYSADKNGYKANVEYFPASSDRPSAPTSSKSRKPIFSTLTTNINGKVYSY